MSLYLLSDTHFDHANIIKYCDRPFESVSEMDRVMRERWNEQLGRNDTILFGGDLAMARSEKAIEYSRKLNGNLILIDGNHDDITQSESPFPVFKSHFFTYNYHGKEYAFYYTHWPVGTDHHGDNNHPYWSEPPAWFDGWYLHGHVHNNDIDNFPFVNPENNYVNLSAELLNYTPIKIEELILALEQNTRYNTVKDFTNDVVASNI